MVRGEKQLRFLDKCVSFSKMNNGVWKWQLSDSLGVFPMLDVIRLGVNDELVQRCVKDILIRKAFLIFWLVLVLYSKFEDEISLRREGYKNPKHPKEKKGFNPPKKIFFFSFSFLFLVFP